jgi:hypothetical protein
MAVLVATLTAATGVAFAQQPINPYGTADVAGAATEPAQVVDPYATQYGQYPPPPAYGYQPPAAGPAVVSPAPPSYQRGYYLYPTGQTAAPPVYYAPSCCQCDPCANRYQSTTLLNPYQYSYQLPKPITLYRRPTPTERIRRFSLGVHGTVLGLANAVGRESMTLGGAGIQLRIRSKGRFGLEMAQSFLYGEALNGLIKRSTYPFTFSLMVYLFPNQDTRHFNLYGLAGIGAQLNEVRLHDEFGTEQTQDFLEWEGHVGLGAELRWKWFAIAADVRALGLLRDDSSTPAAYYGNVQNAPVSDKGWGMSGNVHINLWF